MTIKRIDVKGYKKQLENNESTEDLAIVKLGFIGGVDIRAADEEKRTIPFIISDSSVDRDGDTINVNGWSLENFNKGGSVLYAHNSRGLPVARPIKTWVEDAKLKSIAQFTTKSQNPFGNTVFRLAQGGYVRGASVGFRGIESKTADREGFWYPLDFIKQELLEWSVVPVPSNPMALTEAKIKGIDVEPLLPWFEMQLDNETGLVLPRDEIEAARKAISSEKCFSDGGKAAPVEKAPPENDNKPNKPARDDSKSKKILAEIKRAKEAVDGAVLLAGDLVEDLALVLESSDDAKSKIINHIKEKYPDELKILSEAFLEQKDPEVNSSNNNEEDTSEYMTAEEFKKVAPEWVKEAVAAQIKAAFNKKRGIID